MAKKEELYIYDRKENALITYLAPWIDTLMLPITTGAAIIFRIIRYIGIHRMPLIRSIFTIIGVFPIIDHYYEPSRLVVGGQHSWLLKQ